MKTWACDGSPPPSLYGAEGLRSPGVLVLLVLVLALLMFFLSW